MLERSPNNSPELSRPTKSRPKKLLPKTYNLIQNLDNSTELSRSQSVQDVFREAFSPSFTLSKTSAQIKAWRETP